MILGLATYQAYLLLHVVAAVGWLGGGLTLSILGTRIAKQRDPGRMMVAKPTSDDGLLFTVWALVLALAATLVVFDHRRDAAAAAEPAGR